MDTYANRGYGMTIPKKLKEKRDFLAAEKKEQYKETYRSIVGAMVWVGFDEACSLLLPEIKKLEETLEWYGTKGEGAYSDAKLYLRAESALNSWQEFLGEESEGK